MLNTKISSTASYIYRNRFLYFMLLPGVVLLIIMKYVPMYGVIIAFKDFSFSKGIVASPWNNFANFKRLFHSADFYRIMFNSIYLSLLKIVFTFPFPLVLALMLNEIKSVYFKRVCQTMIYLPHFISWVVIISITKNFLSVSDGLVNESIRALGGVPVSFLGKEKWFRPIIIITSVWRDAGWGTIIYLAALTGVSQELYDAADIDGAGRFKKITHITIPAISSTIVVLLVLAVGRLMSNGFEQVFLLQNPLIMDVADVFETYTYRIGLLQGEFSFSAAVGLFQSVVGLILILFCNEIAKKINGASII